MDIRLKQRIVGIIILVIVLAIVIPLLFTGSKQERSGAGMSTIIPKLPVTPTLQQPVTSAPTVVQTTPKVQNTGVPIVDAVPKTQPGWAVQLASFNNKINADNLIKKLQNKGFDAYVQQIQNKYRVFIGPEVERQQAENLVKQLQRLFNLNGIVVKYKV